MISKQSLVGVRVMRASLCVLVLLALGVMCLGGCVTPAPPPEPTLPPPTRTPTPSPPPPPPPPTRTPPPECVDFEDLPLGAQYHVPDRFSDSGVEITVRAFERSIGDWTTDGFTKVSDAGDAGGSGQEMIVNNVNLDFDFCCTVMELTLRFGEYGGNLNIDVNGIFKNFEYLADIDGSNFDGVTVTVTDGLGNDTGTLKLSGLITSFALGGQELVIDEICYGDCAPAPDVVECVGFEDLPLGTQYHVPERFTDSGVEITVRAFQWSSGDWTTDGYTEVSDAGDAGGSGHGMIVNNVNLDFDFCCTVRELTLKFGEYGGNLNIDVNGIFKNFENFADIDGSNFDGVTVTVTDGLGNDTGTLTLSGPITSFALGGQELVIDEICYGDCAPAPDVVECVGFEDLPLGTQYHVPERFTDSGVEITVRAFQWDNGDWTTDGFAEVSDTWDAGGSGHGMIVNNVNLDFDFCCTVTDLTLKFGEYGGNLNIDINGIFKKFENFADMDGSNFDGVTVTVTDGLGNDTGTLTLSGPITSFALGGQELVIDDICYGDCAPGPDVVECVEFEGSPLAQQYRIFDRFNDSGVEITVAAFHLGGGQWTTDGYAEVTDQGLAGGSGQEMIVNNVNLDFKFPSCSLADLTLNFGEYGGNLNIDTNGEFVDFDNFADIDGQTIGGVDIAVVDGLGNDTGSLKLTGTINSFAVGGQELWIDHICPWVE